MKSLVKTLILTSFIGLSSCGDDPVDPTPTPVPSPTPDDTTIVKPQPRDSIDLVKGADISWCTQMEDNGHSFFAFSSSEPKECTEVMKELGVEAIRLRVLVNPSDGYCNKEDVLQKALRASRLGLDLMIAFHYSDVYATSQNQKMPTAWEGLDFNQLIDSVASHTVEALRLLRENDVTVKWVQIGNETSKGMLFPMGDIEKNPAQYRTLFSVASDSARSVYPDAKIVTYFARGFDQELYEKNLNLLDGNKYDIVGFSLFPSMAVGELFTTTRFKELISIESEEQAIQYTFANMDMVYNKVRKPCMLVEVGLPFRKDGTFETKSTLQMKQIMLDASDMGVCQGVFYLEPESYEGWNGYTMGMFLPNGRPSTILDAYGTRYWSYGTRCHTEL